MSVSTATRVAELLLAFENTSGLGTDHTVSELSRQVGRERSQVCRMLKSLTSSGLVEQDPVSKQYRLGWNFRVLAAQAGDCTLVEACKPILQSLVAKTGEVALLSIQEGNRCLTVLREDSPQNIRGGGWVGRSSEMHCTASGRALLFDSDDEHIRELTHEDVGMATSAPNGPKTVEELLARIEKERRRGYAVASEEVEIGLTSVSAPIRDVRSNIVGVLNVSAPTSRIISRTDQIGNLLIAACDAVSGSLRLRRSATRQ